MKGLTECDILCIIEAFRKWQIDSQAPPCVLSLQGCRRGVVFSKAPQMSGGWGLGRVWETVAIPWNLTQYLAKSKHIMYIWGEICWKEYV